MEWQNCKVLYNIIKPTKNKEKSLHEHTLTQMRNQKRTLTQIRHHVLFTVFIYDEYYYFFVNFVLL